ncbi:MAG TPA: hypothetical protein VM076_19600 [Gemmatimonadaceae bacterium]|nr:hypothetical protein [Gemmatimonadaceae bacterium]
MRQLCIPFVPRFNGPDRYFIESPYRFTETGFRDDPSTRIVSRPIAE